MTKRKARIAKKYAFDPRLGGTGRYVDATTGKIVSKGVVNTALEFQIDAARVNTRAIATNLANGNISLAEYQMAMAREMKTVNTISAALSKGGWENMSQADWGAVGRISRDQYVGLQGYAEKIASGEIKLHRLDGEINGNFLRTSDQFAQGGIQTQAQMERRAATASGNTHEMRVLDSAAEHCDCCIAEAGHAEPIGTLKKIGGCTCANNCRCHFVFGVMTNGKFVEN